MSDNKKTIGIVIGLLAAIFLLAKYTNTGAQSAFSLDSISSFASTTLGMFVFLAVGIMFVVAFFIPKK